jgi:hypothetical protein
MYLNILPTGQEEVIKKLSNYPFIKDFYLSGGTALALQLGHRESVDFDFFGEKDFEPQELLNILQNDFDVEVDKIERGTLNCRIKNIKLQFLHYPYKLLEEFINWDGINLSSIVDIACTKMITVSVRGNKKDYIDIYFLLQKYDLGELFAKMELKYTGLDFNEAHIIKSLTYFNEADEQPMPRMHIETDWGNVKKVISSKAVEYLKKVDVF